MKYVKSDAIVSNCVINQLIPWRELLIDKVTTTINQYIGLKILIGFCGLVYVRLVDPSERESEQSVQAEFLTS